MAAAQAATIETIVNLKAALAKADDSSESDDSIAYTSNRGRKLKRRAKFVYEGKLDDGKGRNGFKEEVEYFGKRKKIIYSKNSRRKRRALESEDDGLEDSEDEGSSSDTLDPYEDVKIEEILAPLESAADLPSHPSLSHVYTSQTLNELIAQSLDKICEENKHTWALKNLYTKFLGDDPFVNLEKMEWPEDDYEAMIRQRNEAVLGSLGNMETTNGAGLGLSGIIGGEGTSKLTNGAARASTPVNEVNGRIHPSHSYPNVTSSMQDMPTPGRDARSAQDTAGHNVAPKDDPTPQEEHPEAIKDKEDEPQQTPPPARRMATRSTAHNQASPAPTSPPVEIDSFFYPPNYHIDRDYGLPPVEAEDTRKLLGMAVQRQDEFVRGLNRVRNDLLRAENLRKKVWSWCRSMEGMRSYHQHLSEVSGNAGKWDIDEGENVGLSDGEDWYDQEEWNLDGPLEKGREEEDEEMLPPGKKTRGRGK